MEKLLKIGKFVPLVASLQKKASDLLWGCLQNEQSCSSFQLNPARKCQMNFDKS